MSSVNACDTAWCKEPHDRRAELGRATSPCRTRLPPPSAASVACVWVGEPTSIWLCSRPLGEAADAKGMTWDDLGMPRDDLGGRFGEDSMKPPPFAFRDPTTLDDALALLADDDNARRLAGGQSLVPMLNCRLVRPSTVVDLNGIAELGGISVTDDGARIGAMVRQVDAAAHDALGNGWPLLRAALAHVAHPQIRNRWRWIRRSTGARSRPGFGRC